MASSVPQLLLRQARHAGHLTSPSALCSASAARSLRPLEALAVARPLALPWLQASLLASPNGLAPSKGPLGASWGPGGGGGVRHRRGGIFRAYVRPPERQALRAVRDEARLKRHGISRYNKRWRSWAQNRVRQYQLPLPVTLTSDTSLMDATYITSCVQKAAALRKHDVGLWRGYSQRILELKNEFLPEQLGYVLWGYGKSSFLDGSFYRDIMPTVKKQLPDFQSHALMSLLWTMKRVKWQDKDVVKLSAQHTLQSMDSLRPPDFVKIANCLASLGLKDSSLRASLSRVAISKLDQCTAQQFRDAVNPVAIGFLWTDEVVVYLLERFRRIFITARPIHLMKAYECAVVTRVQRPEAWRSLSREAKQFYVRLSQRHISASNKEPTPMHWDVSRHLADLGEAHRNAFRWGPFEIDIGLEELEEDERRRCLMVDTPSAFFYGTDQYFPPRLLQHQLLTNLGWDVRRVRWDDWAKLEAGSDEKRPYLQKLLEGSKPVGADLQDRPPKSPADVQKSLQNFRAMLRMTEEQEKAAKSATKIDLFEI